MRNRPMLAILVLSVALSTLGCSDNRSADNHKETSLPRADASVAESAAESAPSGTNLPENASSANEAAAPTDASLPAPGQQAPVAAAAGPYWPCFHGPKGDNISTEKGLLAQWPEQGPTLLWTAQGIGAGYSGVSIADGLIYTSGNIDDKTVVAALDLDGKPRWQREVGPAWTESYPGTRSTPTYDAGHIYYESPLGDVVCLEAKTGEKLWGVNILKEFGANNIQWALAESVLIDGDRAICCPGGPKTAVVALDKKTGQTVWQSPSANGDAAGYATATLAEYQGLRIILTMTAKALIGVNADTGDLLFRVEHLTKYDVNATKPVYHDGCVFISSGYGSGSALVKINVDGGKATAETLWESKDLDDHHGGVILWDGYLYGSCHEFNGAKWVCLDWKTGEMKYAEKGVGKGSATCADGLLYTMSENRAVGLVRPDPAGHEVLSRFELPEGGEGPTWAHPVVCGGRLYLRHGDFLYAYDVRATQ